MTPFVPPTPDRGELYDRYFIRLMHAMIEHYNKVIEELQRD